MMYVTLAIQVPLKRLFSSASDGTSFYTMLKAVNGYKGPSVIVCHDSTGRVVGGYAAMDWVDGGEA